MDIWNEIEQKKQKLETLRPLTSKSLKALSDWYDVEIVFSSNAIEGNTLTRNETAIVIEKGITVRGKPLKDHLEAIDHKDALDFVKALAKKQQPLIEHDIRQIHKLILARSNPAEAGKYSQYQRQIAGSKVVLPEPIEIPALMKDFMTWLGNAAMIPTTAFEAHLKLVAIHPFTDGNGRTARLLMNLILFRIGYPPVVIEPELRADYIDTLELYHTENDKSACNLFLADRLNESLTRYLEALEKEARFDLYEPQ